MAFPQSFLDELVSRNPIDEVVSQYVNLTRKGSNLFGLCPFHSEKTGSFSVAPDKGIYYCFGCHKGGGVINFAMEIENLDYPDAVRFLAKRAGMEVPEDAGYQSTYRRQERLWALCRDAARWYHGKLQEDCGRQAREYLGKRGLSAGTVTRFGMGFAPDSWNGLIDAMAKKGYEKQDLLDAGLALKSEKRGTVYDRFRNRLMFPIIDVRGNVIGFGGRVMDDSTPKYLNSPETVIFNKRKNLFAMNVAKKSKQGRIILTEGYMDAIALHQYGFDCAVASLGTALTEEQAHLLSKYTGQIILTYDGDEAGQNATKRAIPLLEKAGLQVRVLRIQGAKDPDEFLKKYGADRFKVLLDGSQSQMDYRLESLRGKYHLENDDQKVEFLKAAAWVIASQSSPVEREIYGGRVAEMAGITPETMKLEVNKAFKSMMAKRRKEQEKKDLNPAREQQPKVRNIRYDHVRSAMAEEGVLQTVLREESLLDRLRNLPGGQFSVPLLGRAYDALQQQRLHGGLVSLAALEGQFTKEEMEHLSGVAHKGSALVKEDALQDYVKIIREEYAKREARQDQDLMGLRDRLKDKKGLNG
ncbi:MAG: DNA primase [Oscillospiraceae bacterium]|nr:DNA primase [Oscillospiraceae bacterium]